MALLDYYSFKGRPARVRISRTWIVVAGVLVALVALGILRRGPSVSEVQRWTATIPRAASKSQVIAVLVAHGIEDNGNEYPFTDTPGYYFMFANIYCEDDRAITISIEMTNDGHFVEASVSQGYRGM